MSLEKPSPPTAEQENPYYPPGPQPLLFEEFQGIDTSVPRLGVDERKMAWCDGFMPLKKRNLRTLPGKGTKLFTAPGALSIVWFAFYNLGSTAYAAVELSDGSLQQVRLSDGATTQILPPGSAPGAATINIGITQWASQYLIIVASAPGNTSFNGYWVWDGAILYQAGSLGPIVTLTNVGAGYKTNPIVVATGGSGFGATFVATINNGVVTNVTETNPGAGYLPGQTVTLAFSGGNSGGSGASLTAVLSSTGGGSGATFTVTFANNIPGSPDWGISSIVVTNGGSGYSRFTTLNLTITSSGTATFTGAVLSPVISGGVITSVTIVNKGDYQRGGGAPTATLTTSDTGNFTVTSVTGTPTGTNYSASTTIVASGGGSPVQQATFQPIITAGVITGVTIASGGLYGSNTPPTLTVADAPVNASATVELMPFGIQGTAVETYAGHVWVANGNQINASAPGSVVNFATSAGGVSFTASNSKLRVGYTQLLASNGFLFLIGDSATDYISGVTTSGTPPTTTYSYLNADPEIGTPYPASVLTFGNLPMLANSIGVYQLAGSTFAKVSDDLDGSGIPNGLWNSVANFGGRQLSAAKATVFNRKVWMVLVPIIDPISGGSVRKLFMWDGKVWWASTQDLSLTFVASSEINSVLTVYGMDNFNIYPLFQVPTNGFSKVVQSRLWDAPGGYTHLKTSTRLFGVAYVYNNSSPSFTVNVDNENTAAPFTNNPYVITPAVAGYFEVPPQAIGQQGVMTGLTITTQAADMNLISVALQDEIVGFRG
jgi:hypothetical protein